MALLATLAAGTAEAGAQQTLGTNLNARAANVNWDCTVTPPTPFGFISSGVSDCTYLSTVFGAESTATPFPGGVITRVRVKTSAPTGPMRVVVARQIGTTTTGIGCCFWAAESQTFTPRANATTAVNVRLPVENSIDAVNGIRTVDYLAISVLQPGTAIPGQYPGGGLDGSLAFFPRLSRGDSVAGRVDGYGNQVVPLLNADFTPLCGGGTSTAGARERDLRIAGEEVLPTPARAESSAGGCLGGASPRGGSLSSRTAKVPIDCNLTSRCKGKIELRATSGKAKLGKSGFKVPSGDRKKIKVKLTGKGKRKAKGKRKLKVKAKLKVNGAPNETKKIKLKR